MHRELREKHWLKIDLITKFTLRLGHQVYDIETQHFESLRSNVKLQCSIVVEKSFCQLLIVLQKFCLNTLKSGQKKWSRLKLHSVILNLIKFHHSSAWFLSDNGVSVLLFH